MSNNKLFNDKTGLDPNSLFQNGGLITAEGSSLASTNPMLFGQIQSYLSGLGGLSEAAVRAGHTASTEFQKSSPAGSASRLADTTSSASTVVPDLAPASTDIAVPLTAVRFYDIQPSSSPAPSAFAPAATPPVSPTLAQEVAYISGVTSTGAVAAISFQTWNGDGPDSNNPDAIQTYNATMSNASKWAPGGPSAAASAAGSAGGLQLYYFDPAAGYTAAQMNALASGLAMWSAVANIQFAQTNDPSLASLTFESNDGTGPSGGSYESSGSTTQEAIGSTLLNNQGTGTYLTVDTSPTGFDLGNFNNGGSGIGIILHEEGHFLGLGHAGPYNGSNDPGTQQFSAYDSHQYTLMSYISADNPAGKYAASYPLGVAANPIGDSTTWMPLDILAAQSLYGVATTTPLSGGQVFGFNDNIQGILEPYFDFSTITNPFLTLFDTGTNNTFDLSGYSTMETVNLNPGTFSSVNGMVNNVGIAFNTAIDMFVGGTGGTEVTVNADADTITDTGIGNQVDFAKTLASYVVATVDGVATTVTDIATGIVDTLKGVQSLLFSDQTVAVCFLAGVMIETPTGEVAVEDLAVGEMVSTRVAGETVPSPVMWIGTRSVDVGANAADDRYPVRVHAHAFADGVPSRDLLITSEHCLHVDGRLIPARMLVNGASIVVDRSITAFTYFHVELARHAILIADGMESESYLDTGNRGNFVNSPVAAMVPDFSINVGHRSWSDDAAAPLAVDRETVEPIWTGLVARAALLGFGRAEAVTLTNQPDLRLLLDDGRELAACCGDTACSTFLVPAGARPVRLLSRASAPSVAIGPFVDDRRMLGVAVARLVVWSGLDDVEIQASDIALAGWHGAEGGCRWTDGNAALDLPVATGKTFLDVHVAACMTYVVEQPVEMARAA